MSEEEVQNGRHILVLQRLLDDTVTKQCDEEEEKTDHLQMASATTTSGVSVEQKDAFASSSIETNIGDDGNDEKKKRKVTKVTQPKISKEDQAALGKILRAAKLDQLKAALGRNGQPNHGSRSELIAWITEGVINGCGLPTCPKCGRQLIVSEASKGFKCMLSASIPSVHIMCQRMELNCS
jgi:hypothetical protein